MIPHEHKVGAEHLRRKACVYVRQSTLAQVHDHQESTLRQYALFQRAQQLGWPDEQVEVIDDDLGHSASDTARTRTVGRQPPATDPTADGQK